MRNSNKENTQIEIDSIELKHRAVTAMRNAKHKRDTHWNEAVTHVQNDVSILGKLFPKWFSKYPHADREKAEEFIKKLTIDSEFGSQVRFKQAMYNSDIRRLHDLANIGGPKIGQVYLSMDDYRLIQFWMNGENDIR